jgi:hypothetical protein
MKISTIEQYREAKASAKALNAQLEELCELQAAARFYEVLAKERVIEAARAWRKHGDTYASGVLDKVCGDLIAAVDALPDTAAFDAAFPPE